MPRTNSGRARRRLGRSLTPPSEIIVLLDRDGRLIEINETTTRRFARSREDLIDRNIFQLFPPDEAAAYAARLRDVVASGRPARFEDAWKGGRLYDVVLYPAADERGNVIRVAAIARDVTGKKRGGGRPAEADARPERAGEGALDPVRDITDHRTAIGDLTR
ncbi:PAS domain-containing protein [Methanoculleus chikugoensis]|uniref:PAS domain-containing protein n=1 Tax=Methanoculleus chikugoensis TaxID=118126 RepID=UPI0006D14515|nr:PAS domain-containing protein [Methanoculleus chikugoensis]